MMAEMIRIFTHSECLEHRSPPGFPEKPERLERILDRLGETYEVAEPKLDLDRVEKAVEAVHDPRYAGRLRRAVERGDGLIDSADNPLSPATHRAASAAVAVAIEATEWVMAGEDRGAFAAVRPPGHHAEKAQAMGFCYFNNAAVAAQYLIDHHGLERVAILDYDVHHGNGTQHLFEERADVFYGSLHQYPFYPGTGAPGEIGRGEGEGATFNVPLAAGSDDEVYRRAFEDEVIPALEAFAPEFLIVSAGFDAWRGDPLGGMRVSEAGFEHWGRLLGQLAKEHCRGRSLSLLEGGYDVEAVPDLAEIYLGALGV